MPRKEEKIELKKFQQFEKRWIKDGRQKTIDYPKSPIGRYHLKIMPEFKETLEKALVKTVQHYLLNPSVGKEALKERMLKDLSLQEMDELRNQSYKQLEKTALQDKWKMSLSAVSMSIVHSQKKWNLEELPLELDYLYQTIEKVGRGFGVDFLNYEERLYAVKLLDLSLTQEAFDRSKRLRDLEEFEEFMRTQKGPLWIHHAQYHYEKVTKELASHLTHSMMNCYGFQYIPVIGLVTGALENYMLVQKVAEISLQFYKRRMIECNK